LIKLLKNHKNHASTENSYIHLQGRRQKIFQEEGNGKKTEDRKLAK